MLAYLRRTIHRFSGASLAVAVSYGAYAQCGQVRTTAASQSSLRGPNIALVSRLSSNHHYTH